LKKAALEIKKETSGSRRKTNYRKGFDEFSSSPYFGLHLVLTRAISRDKNYFTWVQDVLNQIELEG